MIYFDNAATTFPKPKVVTDKLHEVYTEYAANPGRSGHKFALRMDREIYGVRDALTHFVGGSNPMNTVFTANCTESLNIAIKGVVTKKMHVISDSMQHNSVLRPLYALEAAGQIELTIVRANDQGILHAQDILSQILPNTGLVVSSHMSNLTGAIYEIKAIGEQLEKEDILFIVDAAQSIGVLDIDVKEMHIDVLCYPGHKGLYGPMGTGGLYIRDGLVLEPMKQGGTGSFSSSPLQPTVMPDRLESGTPNGPGIIALGVGLEFIEQTKMKRIRDWEDALAGRFREGLDNIPQITTYGDWDHPHGAVVALNMKEMDSAQLGYILSEDYDIYIRPGLHCAPLAHESLGTSDYGACRFSFGFFNTEGEVDYALEVLEKIAKENM